MAVNWSDVSALDAPLAAVPAATQLAILSLVRVYLNATAWGDLYDQATLLLAAHFGSMSIRGGGATGAVGPVQSESAGSVSRSYASVGGSSGSSMDSTVWGQQYRTLARAVFGGGMVI